MIAMSKAESDYNVKNKWLMVIINIKLDREGSQCRSEVNVIQGVYSILIAAKFYVFINFNAIL